MVHNLARSYTMLATTFYQVCRDMIEFRIRLPKYVSRLDREHNVGDPNESSGLLIEILALHGRLTTDMLYRHFVRESWDRSQQERLNVKSWLYEMKNSGSRQARLSVIRRKLYKLINYLHREKRYIVKVRELDSDNDKLDVLEKPISSQTMLKDQAWMINHTAFLLAMRNSAIKLFVTQKFDILSGQVVKRMLDTFNLGEFCDNVSAEARTAARSYGGTSKQEIDHMRVRITKDMIAAQAPLPNSFFEREQDIVRLEEMSKDMKGLREQLNVVDKQDEGWVVNTLRIIRVMRAQDIMIMIRRRFGNAGGRIFRVLMDRKNVEPKQITELAMVSRKVVHGLLAQMLREGYVVMKEQTKSVSETQQTVSYFVYGVCFPELQKWVAKAVLDAYLCISTKLLAYEQDESFEMEGLSRMSAEHKKLLNKKMIKKLVMNLSHLDDKMLLHRWMGTEVS